MAQQDLNDLETEVSETVGIMESAKVLIDGFAARLEAAGTDPAKLKKLRDDLNNGGDSLAAAVAANQPAKPANPA
jgi:hypothetical protein